LHAQRKRTKRKGLFSKVFASERTAKKILLSEILTLLLAFHIYTEEKDEGVAF